MMHKHEVPVFAFVTVALAVVGVLVGGWVGTTRTDALAQQLAAAEARADSANAIALAWADSARIASARVTVDTLVLRETVTRWRVSVDTLFRDVPATPRESALVATCDAVVSACEAARDAQAVEAGYLRQQLFAERAGRSAEREAFQAMARQQAAARRRERVWFTLAGAAAGVVAWEVVR